MVVGFHAKDSGAPSFSCLQLAQVAAGGGQGLASQDRPPPAMAPEGRNSPVRQGDLRRRGQDPRPTPPSERREWAWTCNERQALVKLSTPWGGW